MSAPEVFCSVSPRGARAGAVVDTPRMESLGPLAPVFLAALVLGALVQFVLGGALALGRRVPAAGALAVVPESGSGLESCHALYAKAARPVIAAAMAAGERAPHRLFARLDARIVAKAALAAIDPTFRSLANLNTRDDLARV